MIHTAQFYYPLGDIELKLICSRFKETPLLLSKKIDIHFHGIITTFTKRPWGWTLYVNIDFIKLLGTADISEKDLTEIEYKINDFICHVFGDEDKELTLIRLDFRFDVVVEDEAHRKLLLKLYKKTIETYSFKKKYDQYASSIYFNSKSMQVICYDKEVERRDKHQVVEPYESGVLRFEVRLLNRHLNYIKRQYGSTKSLINYLRDDVWKSYMSKHLCPFFFAGNFYKINIATDIIDKSDVKEMDKTKLREFLCDVSKCGLEGIKKLEKDGGKKGNEPKYTKYLVNKYLKLLKQLEINPLLIPKNMKIELGTEKCIYNPLPASIIA